MKKSLRELGVKWTLADAQHAGGVGQVTTLGSDLSVATATTHVGFNIGRINGRLLDLELSALEQKTAAGYYRQSASAGLTSSACQH